MKSKTARSLRVLSNKIMGAEKDFEGPWKEVTELMEESHNLVTKELDEGELPAPIKQPVKKIVDKIKKLYKQFVVVEEAAKLAKSRIVSARSYKEILGEVGEYINAVNGIFEKDLYKDVEMPNPDIEQRVDRLYYEINQLLLAFSQLFQLEERAPLERQKRQQG